ncbi:MAG: type I DNA topoisomerase [Dehalococcoidia bacterium]|nr:type I DNA topoisomerase [Dehalococcoidia bacterium]
MPKKLVIVESPAKARTLSKMLGKDYVIKASMGHVRDLPKSTIGVDVENDFEPKYVNVKEKSKIVSEIREAANGASAIYLATDPDREGEAISWHLVEAANLLKDNVPIRRVAFHEITKEAVEAAFHHPRSVDMNLVNAQQARRVLDRLVGYMLSPLLWRKVRRGLSAGRVQSSALKLLVDREREIGNFKPQEYWVIKAEVAKPSHPKTAFWADFIGKADGVKLPLDAGPQARRIVKELREAKYKVKDKRTKESLRQPSAPFITSTMQQEAWRKLRFSADRTMRVAQQLYEGLAVGEDGEVGLITYMRTDSTHVAPSAIAETREYISQKYGDKYLPATARHFVKKGKFAQEAHEAIRPTSVKREPTSMKQYLDSDQFKLYDLIWKRMVASQMSPMALDSTIVDVVALTGVNGDGYLLRTTASVVTFPGFSTLYTEGKDEDDEAAANEETFPPLDQGDALDLLDLPDPEQRFTLPPPRYTESSLIKALEQKGIGRPSTYASIVTIVVARDYAKKIEGKFHAEELGEVVSDLLVQNFPDVSDIGFTAHMEEELDEIARGEKQWIPVIREFYAPFLKDLNQASEKVERVRFKEEPAGENCPKCGKPMVIKQGRFGKFIACTGYPECKTTKPLDEPAGENCPKCGKPMAIRLGRFGKYVVCTGYPECKTTHPFFVKIGVRCPECGNELIERENKRKKPFWACSGYPNCKFLTGSRPVAAPCPQCKGLMVLAGRGNVKCTKCEYAGPLVEESAEGEAVAAGADSAVAE